MQEGREGETHLRTSTRFWRAPGLSGMMTSHSFFPAVGVDILRLLFDVDTVTLGVLSKIDGLLEILRLLRAL